MQFCVPLSHVPEAKRLAKIKKLGDVSITTEQIHANSMKELSSILLLFSLGFGYR